MTAFDITTASLHPGVTLIEASAGTGKTFSIAGLILRLILEEHLPLRDILAVTFTEAATEELRNRVRRRLQTSLHDLGHERSDDPIVAAFLRQGDVAAGIMALNLALQSFDEAQIFTIHGFCQRMLNDYAFESGTRFDTTLLVDPTPLFEEVARDFWRLRFYQTGSVLPVLATALNQSVDTWVALLEQTRRHPDLVILPPREARSASQLLQDVESAFAPIKKEWGRHHAEIEKLLRTSRGLSEAKEHFRADNIARIVPLITQACEGLRYLTSEAFEALKKLSMEGIAEGTKKRTGKSPDHPFFALSSDFCHAVEALSNQLTHEFLQFANTELPKRKARTNAVTYDDLIIELRNALRGKEGDRLARAIRKKYSAALIDEFQDTDPAQYEIFRTIFDSEDHRLFLIGDPKQAIFGFRGADVFTYLEAKKIAQRTFTMTTNWRSEAPLIDAINQIFSTADNPFHFSDIQFHRVQSPEEPLVDRLTGINKNDSVVNFRLVTLSEGKADFEDLTCISVSGDIATLHGAKPAFAKRSLRFNDMAVLVGMHREAEKVQDALRERGIRSVVQSDKSVFDTDQARELQRFLQGVINPRRDALLKDALATTLLGFDAEKLFALDQDDRELQLWLDRFLDWRERWVNGSFTAMFRHLFGSQNVRARLVQLPAGERRLTNFLHLAELLHEAESSQSLSPDAVCSWLREQRKSERVSEDRYQLRLESDEDAVRIVTIHKSKGLEYPVVFCPFLWKNAESKHRDELLFHDRNTNNRLTFDLRGKKVGEQQHQDWQTEEVKAEKMRLLYVAVTRAMNRCYIYLPDRTSDKKIEKSALAHLFPLSGNASLVDRITAFAQSSKGTITAAMSEPKASSRANNETPSDTALQCRTFNGTISKIAMTSSFTGLNAIPTEGNEANSDTAIDITTVIDPPSDGSDLSIFSFSRGRRTGDFFHDLLEHLDFENLEELPDLLEEKLRIYRFSETLHRPVLIQILQQLMEMPLAPGFRLRDIPRKERLSELDFFYPLKRCAPADLARVIRNCANLNEAVATRMGRLSFDPVEGFMNGTIDLLFRFQDRYYLIDWKSNWLGNQSASYGSEGMQQAMMAHNYYLQYHLYTLAADLFLEKRVPGYDYEKHFGGVYYIFLRGIDPSDPTRGIFRDRPAVETVRSFRTLLA